MRVSVNTDKLFDIKKYKNIEEFANMLGMEESALRTSSDGTIRPLLSQIDQFTSRVNNL